MQHILIPTDFSENAWNATAYAMHFFKNEIIAFHFLHIDIALQTISGNEETMYAGLSIKCIVPDLMRTRMESWMQQVNYHFSNPNHTYEDSILKAPFIEGMREYIKKNDISFIVMGTKGASGLKEMTIGSKAGAVITRVKCPILVIPEEAKYKQPINIGFPTDFNILYKQKIVKTLLEIARLHHSSIKVLRVAQTKQPLDNFQNNNRDALKNQFTDVPHSFHVIEHPNLEDALQSFVTTMKIDMVAMIAKNLNFIQRILFRPQVTKISYHTQIPFLVLHE